MQRHHFGTQFVDEHLSRHGLPFGDPHQVIRFGVGDQQIAEILAGREDLQEDRQRFPITLKQRGQRKRIAAGRHEAVQIIQRHVGVAQPRQLLGKLFADRSQQVECDARQRGAHQAGVGALDIVQTPSGQPVAGFLRTIEILAQFSDIHIRLGVVTASQQLQRDI